ncbi:MAG: FAD-dependent oxidoreductase [Oscillospiraceae bacterium]
MDHLGDYEVVVIGAGHAGIEAARAAAKLGSQNRPVHPYAGRRRPTCPATRPSAAPPRAIWCGRSTRWAA